MCLLRDPGAAVFFQRDSDGLADCACPCKSFLPNGLYYIQFMISISTPLVPCLRCGGCFWRRCHPQRCRHVLVAHMAVVGCWKYGIVDIVTSHMPASSVL
jgi:hypothetical protein